MKKLLLLTIAILAAWSGWSQSITQGADKDYSVQMNVGETAGASYAWSVSPANGTTTDLSTVTDSVATITWDGPAGIYTVLVQVTDGNGCLGEPIIQAMEIVAPGNLFFAAALPSTQTCSELSGGIEGSVPAQSESMFSIAYDGDANLASVNLTIENPAGEFVDLTGMVLTDQSNPEITIQNLEADKEVEFAVNNNWENTGTAEVNFEIVVLGALTADNSEITANAAGDTERTITILPKPVIAFE